MGGTAWLFCSNGKYYVTYDFGDDLCDILAKVEENQNLVCEVDELIAEQLAKLCNKGYITQFSCSGHPFGVCAYRIITDENEIKHIDVKNHVAVTKFSNDGQLAVCDLDKPLDDEMYIYFVEHYPFESIPIGWMYQDATLRTRIHTESTIDFFRQALIAVENLNDWIDRLPNNDADSR